MNFHNIGEVDITSNDLLDSLNVDAKNLKSIVLRQDCLDIAEYIGDSGNKSNTVR